MEANIIERMGIPKNALAGRAAVVTGAGQGIGREIALLFAGLGAKVVIAELTEAGADVEKQIRDSGGEAIFVQTDIASQEDVDHLAQESFEAYGAIDILINNAIVSPVVRVLDMDVDTLERVLAVNLKGAFLTCKAFLPEMLKRNEGTIVNMVSTDAMPYLSAYIASKQGLAAFSQSLAGEVGESQVSVIAFAPGFVATPGLRGVSMTLAPHLGMDPDQFLNLSLHPAYEGAMPVEDAAAATAYLVIQLAHEYHGEITNGYTVLERSGYLSALSTAAPEAFPGKEARPPAAEKVAGRRIVEISRELERVLAGTEDEFGRLPIFVRPLARSGFKSKAGQSLQEWKHLVSELTQRLVKVDAGDSASKDILCREAPQLKPRLEKLTHYYQGVPAETARFTKDEAMLREVEELTRHRVVLIQSMVEALESICNEI